MHQIADAADIQDHVILGDVIDDAGELADHASAAIDARARAGEMRMRDGGGQRVGGIGLLDAAQAAAAA